MILEEALTDPEGHYKKGSWLRLPSGDMPALLASGTDTLLYLKTGHLSSGTLTGVT